MTRDGWIIFATHMRPVGSSIQDEGHGTLLGRLRGKPSLAVVLGLCALFLVLRLADTSRNAFTWDVFGYYLYLPALVIHGDPGLQDHAWLEEVMETYAPSATLYQLVDGADGARVIKYSSGMAVAYAPFFLVAHALAGPMGYRADGFTKPYREAVMYGTLLHVLIGLFLFRAVLLHFFSEAMSALLIVLMVLGTNHLQLAALDGTLLTHPLLFTLYAGLVLATIRWHLRPTWGMAVVLGALAGWITLIRPSEGVCLLITLLWCTNEGWRGKWAMLRARPLHVLWAALAFAVALLPQLLYWQAVTGHWLFYSYVNAGEGLDLTAPHTFNYLFSFRKGWFIYTPLMVICLLGLVLLWRKARHVFWPVAVFLVVDLYVVSSWTNWWYAGGSYSARSMLPAHVVLAIPLGYLLLAAARSRWMRPALGALLVALVVLNLFQTWQWRKGIIARERMTGPYYAAIFGRTQVPEGAEALLLVERPITEEEVLSDTTGYRHSILFRADYDDRPDSVFTLTDEEIYAPGPHVTYAELTDRDHAWLRASARLWVGDTLLPPPVLVLTFHHEGETYKYRTVTWDIPEHTRNEWVDLTVDYITPEARSTSDDLKVYVWNKYGGTHRIDDLHVELFVPQGSAAWPWRRN